MSEASLIDSPPCVVSGIDPGLRTLFNRAPFELTHHLLSDHHLFVLPRLLELAKTMAADDVFYDAGDIKIGQR